VNDTTKVRSFACEVLLHKRFDDEEFVQSKQFVGLGFLQNISALSINGIPVQMEVQFISD